MHHTILHQMNDIFKQKSLMSEKYSHSCSSCTNVNNFSVKHIVEDCMHNADRACQFAFLFIHDTLQKFNPRKIFKYNSTVQQNST